MISNNCSAGEHRHCGGQLKFASESGDGDDVFACECRCHRQIDGMSDRENRIRIHCSSERFNVSAVDVLYLLGVIDVIREDRKRLRDKLDRLTSAVDTIPAAVMLAGGPPYRLTFTEACLLEILESQK